MKDKRSERRSSVVQFLSNLDKNRIANRNALIDKAQTLELEGFDFSKWTDPVWTITAGRLLKLGGKNINKLTLSFKYAPELIDAQLDEEWSDLIKAIVVLRFHRVHQSAPNQRNFISAISYVAYVMVNSGQKIYQLTPEYLNQACKLLAKDYSPGVTYNMHKAIGEFAAHCDANGLCNVLLDYKYYGMKRPENTGGIDHKRLDDPDVLMTKGNKIVDPMVFKIIGELYLKVPTNHDYRFYVLVLTLMAMLGRRFSEISTLPNQVVSRDEEGRAYLNYFPRKTSTGDVFTPMRKLYLATDVVLIVEPVVLELKHLCASARDTAIEMCASNGPNLFFLIDYSDDKKFFKEDLQRMGISSTVIEINGWIRKNGYAYSDADKITSQGKLTTSASWYTLKKGIVEYCKRNFLPSSVEPIQIDQFGKKYYLGDMLLVKHIGLAKGVYAHWVASQMTHSMMTTFLRYFSKLSSEFVSINREADFTSHHFRHTLNTLLDEGGLTDLLQTEWFGRSNPKDTKAYQHTSREKRALELRADIKAGKVGGMLAEQIKFMPIDQQEAVLAARVNAVLDVGPGICVHNHAQNSCSRHMQCSAECNDYLWVRNDEGRKEELKRIYAMTFIARQTAEKKTNDPKPKKSADWLLHNDKKLKILSQQLKDNNIEPFDPLTYFEEDASENKIQSNGKK